MAHKVNIAGELSTIIFNLADIENFDPNIPLTELNLDPMELIEALRKEFGVAVEEDRLSEDLTTIDSLTEYYEDALQEPVSAENAPSPAAPIVEDDNLGTQLLSSQLDRQSIAKLQIELLEAVAKEPDSPIAALVQEQLETMRQQLEMLKTQTGTGEHTTPISANSAAVAQANTPPSNEIAGRQATVLGEDELAMRLASENGSSLSNEQEEAALDAMKALEAALDADEKTQIFLPELADALEAEVKRREAESVLLEPVKSAENGDMDVTQIYMPRGEATESTASSVTHDDATQILLPNDEQSILIEAAQSTHGESAPTHDDATQIFLPERDTPEVEPQAAVEAPNHSAPTQIFLPDHESSAVQPEATAENHDGATQIFLPADDAPAPNMPVEAPVEHDAPTRIFVRDVDGVRINDEDDLPFRDALLEQAAAVKSDGRGANASDDATQIFLPDSGGSAEMLGGQSGANIDATEDATQIFLPETDAPVEMIASESTGLQSNAPDDATQIFLPEAQDSAELVSEVADDRTQIFIAEDAQPQSEQAAEQEAVTQIFLPDAGEVDEGVDSAEVDAIAQAELRGDLTQIFIPEDEQLEMADAASEVKQAPVADMAAEQEAVTQIFLPESEHEASRTASLVEESARNDADSDTESDGTLLVDEYEMAQVAAIDPSLAINEEATMLVDDSMLATNASAQVEDDDGTLLVDEAELLENSQTSALDDDGTMLVDEVDLPEVNTVSEPDNDGTMLVDEANLIEIETNDTAVPDDAGTMLVEDDGQPAESIANKQADVTQIFLPEEEVNDGTMLVEESAHAESDVPETQAAVTQIFLPETDAAADDGTMLVGEDAQLIEAAATPEVDPTQIFMPESFNDAGTMISEPRPDQQTNGHADVTQIFLPEEPTSIDAEPVRDSGQAAPTQIFLPEHDSETPHIESSEKSELGNDNPTQIFLPEESDDVADPFIDDEVYRQALEAQQRANAHFDQTVTGNSDATQIFVTPKEDVSGGEADSAELIPFEEAEVERALAKQGDVIEQRVGGNSDATQIFLPGNDGLISAPEARDVVSVDSHTEIFSPDTAGITQAGEHDGIDAEPFSSTFPILQGDEPEDGFGGFTPDADVAGDESGQSRSSEQKILEIEPLPPLSAFPPAVAAAPDYAQREKPSGHLGQFELAAGVGTVHMSARQRTHLWELVERVLRKTAKSRAHAKKFGRYQADAKSAEFFHAAWRQINYPIVAARSKDARIWDIDGNEYVDITLGGGVHFLGHAPDFISGALSAELNKGYELGIQNRLAGEVAQTICDMTGAERATFTNSGADATRLAIRLARLTTGRRKVVVFKGSHHGDFDEVLARATTRDEQLLSASAVPGIPNSAVDDVYVLQYDSAETLDFIRDNAAGIAAVLVEPVQRFNPAKQPQTFLRDLREITSMVGSALIFDETVSGFRVAAGGIQQAWGVRADMATFGSTIAAGLPLGVLAGEAMWLDSIDGGVWSVEDNNAPAKRRTYAQQTVARHPLAIAAANASLTYMLARGDSLHTLTNGRVARLSAELNQLFSDRELPIRVDHFSSWFRFSIPAELSYADLISYHLRENGVYIADIRQTNFISVAHTDDDIDRIIAAVDKAVTELQHSRFLPAPANAPFPLSTAQQSIWLASQLGETASTAFNSGFSLRMQGEVDERTLQDALQMVVQRHEALHLTFSADGKFQQVNKASAEEPIVLHDWRTMPEAEQEARYWQLNDHASLTDYQLESGPMYRLNLVRFGEEDYLLHFAAHRLVFDEWSANVFVDELRQLYNGLIGERTIFLPPMTAYRDFVAHEEETLASSLRDQSLAFWKNELTPLPKPLTLPTKGNRPMMRTLKGATFSFELDEIVTARAQAVALKHDLPFRDLLLTSFAALMALASKQDDFVIGLPIAQQRAADMDWLVGSAENLIPLRIQMGNAKGLSNLLHTVREAIARTAPHQMMTYGTLLQSIRVPRELGRTPLIQTVFNMSQTPQCAGFADMAVTFMHQTKTATNFDLVWNVRKDADSFVIDADFNSAVLDEAQLETWVTQYENILEEFAQTSLEVTDVPPAAPVAIPTPEPAPVADPVPEEWNRTSVHYPTNITLVDLFTMQVTETPNKIAIKNERGNKLTYKGIDRKSNRLAGYLRAQETGKNARVGVCLSDSADVLTAILGVAKAGCTLVMLDHTLPTDALNAIRSNARLGLVLSDSVTVDAMADATALGKSPILLDEGWHEIGKHRDTASNHADKDADAVIVYEHNDPIRGVRMSHASLSNLLMSLIDNPGIEGDDVLLSLSSASQPSVLVELLMPLLMGARVAVASPETRGNASQIVAAIKKQNATVLHSDPETLQAMVAMGWEGNSKLTLLVKQPVSADLVDTLSTRCREAYGVWGSTESGIIALLTKLEPEQASTLGRPIANAKAFVLNDAMQPIGIGQVGTLFIAGEGVAQGYAESTEAVNTAFVDNPFAPPVALLPMESASGARNVTGGLMQAVMVNTGLQAMWREDGVIALPVEETIAESNADQDASAVEPVQSSFGPQPTQIILPMGRDEAVVADIWRAALDRQTVDANADFFALGGHSLMAMQVLAKIEEKLGVSLTMSEFMANPTVSGLVERIGR